MLRLSRRQEKVADPGDQKCTYVVCVHSGQQRHPTDIGRPVAYCSRGRCFCKKMAVYSKLPYVSPFPGIWY